MDETPNENPSPEEIRAECERIRAEWGPLTRWHRSGGRDYAAWRELAEQGHHEGERGAVAMPPGTTDRGMVSDVA